MKFFDTNNRIVLKDGHKIVEIACIETRSNSNWKHISQDDKSKERRASEALKFMDFSQIFKR